MFPDGEFKQKFSPNDWVKKYSNYKEVEQITEEEKRKIKQEGIKRKKEYKKERFQAFLEKLGIGKKVSKLPEGTSKEVILNKIDFKYDAFKETNNLENPNVKVVKYTALGDKDKKSNIISQEIEQ